MNGGGLMAKKPLFSLIGSVYFNAVNRLAVAGITKGTYAYKKFPELCSIIGCEGDKDAPIVFIDGSYKLRGRGGKIVSFGVSAPKEKINWYNAEGFLPCLVSEYKKDGVSYCVKSFADKVTVDGNDFEIVYSRFIAANKSGKAVQTQKASKLLVPLNKVNDIIGDGEILTADFAVAADKFGNSYSYPEDSVIKSLGSFDEHFDSMKSYWLKRLEPLTEITDLPDRRLIDAYKAGYIYTMICKDGYELHVGENGYDRVFDHDVIGILNTLLLLGDFRDIEEYSKYILQNVQYPDARWKYSWFFAVYLMKTGNRAFVLEKFYEIKENSHSIASSRLDGGKGIMKKTVAIDSLGCWTIDNFSALTGLCSYAYICRILGKTEENAWAEREYDSLLEVCDRHITETVKKYGLDYLPMNMDLPNSETARSDPRDANRLSMFLFGRWSFDAYLFGAKQYGPLLDLTDATYEHSAKVRKNESDTMYNFGGYPHGYFCSAYNAGYGSAALRGEKYRDTGIKAYQFMIDYAQSGPYSWWEGIKYPNEKSPWSINHAAGGGGSCPHMWGQSTATKVLLDSLICEKADGTLIIGRGIPEEWLFEGSKISVKKYPAANGNKVSLDIEVKDGKTLLKVDALIKVNLQVDIPKVFPIELI